LTGAHHERRTGYASNPVSAIKIVSPLPPFEASAVINRARVKLRRRREVPLDRLRAEAFGRYLIAAWEEEADVLVMRSSKPP
jgi:hypothetical protein